VIGVPPGSKRAAWRAVLFAQNTLVRIFDDELQRDCGTPLPVYDVLIRIWLAPRHTLRMSELAESAVLSRSWITRRVERLEQSGLVERFSADNDGRGICVRLTTAGEQAFARLEASHARSIVLPDRGRGRCHRPRPGPDNGCRRPHRGRDSGGRPG
jgi:DNA-binding MarR family transcriptional regulator